MSFKDDTRRQPSEQSAETTKEEPDGMAGRAEHSGQNDLCNAVAGNQGRRPATTKIGGRPQRAMAVLGRGRSVIVVGHDLTIDRWIKILQEALAKARRAKSYGLELSAFVKMLADLSRP